MSNKINMKTIDGLDTALGSVVDLSSTQTITGNKTFTGNVTVPAPTNNTDAATKKYVDDIVGDIETLLASI